MAKIRDKIPDEEERITPLRVFKDKVIKYIDSFIFRNHYVRL